MYVLYVQYCTVDCISAVGGEILQGMDEKVIAGRPVAVSCSMARCHDPKNHR